MFKWSIRTKLLIGLGMLLVIVATLSWGGIHGLYAYRGLVRSLSRRVSELPLAGEFSRAVSDLRVALSQTRTLRDLAAAGQHATPGSIQFARAAFDHHLDEVETALQRYRDKLAENPDRSGRISDSRRERQTVEQIEGVLAGVRALRNDAAWLLDAAKAARLEREVEQLEELALQLPGFLHENIREFTDHARVQYRTLIVLSWITSVTVGVMVLLLVNLFYRWIFHPLGVLIAGSRRVAAGDFQHRIRLATEDEMAELAEAMNSMTRRFQAIRDDLDRQVQERTKQVVRSEQLASVGFLAAGVAHEINNPLASIAMCAESLEGRLGDLSGADAQVAEVFRDYLRMIQAEAFRCKEITERLLDFSRIGEMRRAHTDLRELVQSVLEMLRHLGKYQDKLLELLPGGAVWVWVNPQEIKQVVLNLLVNALDSVDAGGRVTVSIDQADGEAVLAVADNGCGMTPEVLEHLFEPFFTRRRGGQGTGLGLSISYRIVSNHEGTIEAHSDGPGRGARFTVRLPLAPQSKEAYHRSQAA